MTPKEKARELVDKYMDFAHVDWDDKFGYDYIQQHNNAKQCALIAVDEILQLDNFSIEGREYWKEVKQEINNL